MATRPLIKILAQALYNACKGQQKTKIEERVARAVKFLKVRRLEKYGREFLAELERVHLKETNAVTARVTSRHPLSTAHMSEIRKYLAHRTKKEPSVQAIIDPGVIGGFSIRCGDLLIDATVKGQIKKMIKHLSMSNS